MQTITDDDTLETLNAKLRARHIVVMRIAKRGPLWHAVGSRTDTFTPAAVYGRTPMVAIRRLTNTLAAQ